MVTLPEASGTPPACRANAWYALARTLTPPGEWQENLPDLVDSGLSGLPDPLPDLGSRLAGLIADHLDSREPVAVAHARAFLGPFELLVAPWASFYLESEPQLMGAVSQYAARAYADAGLAPGEKLLDAPDHVTHELEFMYFLAFNEAATGDSSWAERQVCFWREHLGLWLPQFADAVTRAGIHPVYDGLAQILSWLCALQDAQQGPADPAPSTSRGSASNAHLSSIC